MRLSYFSSTCKRDLIKILARPSLLGQSCQKSAPEFPHWLFHYKMGGSYSKYDLDASLENAYEMLNNHAEELNKLSSWREEVDNKIKAIDMRISLGNNTQSTGSSADVQSLLKNVDVHAESERLRADIKALSTLIDQNTAEIGHWKGEIEALPAKFHGILGAEVNTMNAKYHALSTKVDNGFNNSPPAINRGLAIGIPLGLGIPLSIAVIFLCALWIRRRYDFRLLSPNING
jgi:hypothetical protein